MRKPWWKRGARVNDLETVTARLIDGENGCRVWTGHLAGNYGQVSVDGKRWCVHVYVYTQVKGAVPKGYEVDHLCFNRLCANPEHLEAVTPEENRARWKAHAREFKIHRGKGKNNKPKPIIPPRPPRVPKPPHIPKKLGRPLGSKDSGPRKPRKNKSSDP